MKQKKLLMIEELHNEIAILKSELDMMNIKLKKKDEKIDDLLSIN